MTAFCFLFCFLPFFMCSHEHNFLLMHRLCVCLLSTESFNTSRQSIVRGAMFGPVSLLKDALHRAVRAKSGEVNKTKPRVPLICCFFSPPPPFLFYYYYDLFPLGFVVFGVWLRGRMASFGRRRIIAFCQTFLEAATKQEKKKHHINSA